MTTSFSAESATSPTLVRGADPAIRSAAATTALELPAPSAEAEAWRYGPINDLRLESFAPRVAPPTGVMAAPAPEFRAPAAVVTVIDGWITHVETDPTWAERGLGVGPAAVGAARTEVPDVDQIDRWHEAFSPDAVVITVKAGLDVTDPVVVRNHHSGEGVAAFPHVRVETGADAGLTVIELQTSGGGAGLSVPLVELSAGDASRLRYVTVQELDNAMWQLGRQVSSVGSQASLESGIAAFGGAYARVRTDTRLAGRGASGDLVSVYYADGDQVHDFRTFQHHDAPDTLSDLLFKGTVDDRAGSIYTGMIHIHPDGRGSNAHQTNRNIKLSDDAWAWSVPNLEIENNDVRCSHASTVSPVDVDQRFYLHARGVPPIVADRLIVAGFFREVIERLPSPALRAEVQSLVEAKLDRRSAVAA